MAKGKHIDDYHILGAEAVLRNSGDSDLEKL